MFSFFYRLRGAALVIASLIAIIGGLAVYFLFLSPRKKQSYADNPKLKFLYRFLHFDVLVAAKLLKALYSISIFAVTLYAIILVLTPGHFIAGLCTLVFGNFLLRIVFEFALILFNMHEDLGKLAGRDPVDSNISPFFERKAPYSYHPTPYSVPTTPLGPPPHPSNQTPPAVTDITPPPFIIPPQDFTSAPHNFTVSAQQTFVPSQPPIPPPFNLPYDPNAFPSSLEQAGGRFSAPPATPYTPPTEPISSQVAPCPPVQSDLGFNPAPPVEPPTATILSDDAACVASSKESTPQNPTLI